MREQEVLETAVGEAVRPGMPAEIVERDRMRRDPAPAWGGVGKGLVLDLKRLPGTDRFDDVAQRMGIDAANGAGDRVEGRQWPIQVSSCVTMPSEIDRSWDR